MKIVPITQVQVRSQIRKVFDEESHQQLAASIKEVGLLQPILCRIENGVLIVIDGERRLRACQLAGLIEIKIIIDEDVKKADAIMQQQIIANIQRVDLGAIEKAEAIHSLMEAAGCNAQQVAKKLGMSPPAVTKSLAVLSLAPQHRELVSSGAISASAAYELSMVEDLEERDDLARQFAEGKVDREQAATTRRNKERAKQAEATPCIKRASAFLGNGRFVTVTGGELTIDSFISSLEELLTKAKRSRNQGVSLPTLIKLLKDQSSVS